jgi:hypothetical protein
LAPCLLLFVSLGNGMAQIRLPFLSFGRGLVLMPSFAMQQVRHCFQVPSQTSGAGSICYRLANRFKASEGSGTRCCRNSISAGWLCFPVADTGGALKGMLDAEIQAESIDCSHFQEGRKYLE